MSIPELRALIEPYLDSQGYEIGKRTRTNARSYIKKLVDFMQKKNYSEISNQVISEYIKSYEGTSQLGARKKRCEEFAEYVKGERQISMIDEKKLENENEVAADTDVDMAMKQESETPEPLENEPTNESVQSVSDVAGKNEPEPMNESAQSEASTAQAEPQKAKGRPPKAKNEKSKREQISLYVDSDIYAKLKDIAQFKKMNVSDILCIAMKDIVERNYEKVKRIQQYIESENIEI